MVALQNPVFLAICLHLTASDGIIRIYNVEIYFASRKSQPISCNHRLSTTINVSPYLFHIKNMHFANGHMSRQLCLFILNSPIHDVTLTLDVNL